MDCAVYKVVVIGREGTGKSSIVNMYATKEFSSQYTPTIGMEFQSQRVAVSGKMMLLQIWDTAGQEKFNAIVRQFYNKAHCAIFVYGIDEPDWRPGVEFWMREAKAVLHEETLLVLVANKADLPRVATNEEGAMLAKMYRVDLFFEISAKSCPDVERLFAAITAELWSRTKLFSGKDSSLFCLSTFATKQPGSRCC